MKLIDTHVHLNDSKFQNDLAEVINNATINGIDKMINVGFDLPSSIRAIEISEKYDNIWTTVGIHPSDTLEVSEKILDEINDLAKNKHVVAIGEIGLDYHYDKIDQEKQKLFLVKQMQIAWDLELPIIIHSRDADTDILNILRNNKFHKAVIHCFSGDDKFAKKCLEEGCYLSYTGIITFSNAKSVREALRVTPLDKLMIETDCPYLAPQKYRGSRNEPAYLIEIATKVGEVKGISFEKVASLTGKNAHNFFKLIY